MNDRPLTLIRPSPWDALRLPALALALMMAHAGTPALSAPAPQESQIQRGDAPVPPQAKAGGPAETKPSNWQRLSASERQALAPLSGTWDQLSPTHRKKWLEISRNFPSLQAQEQAKMHQRMREWALLSAEERARARLNFGKTSEIARELSPAEKLAKWQAYQALPPEQRLKLAERAKTRNIGAAPAPQPIPAQKLAVLPAPGGARGPKVTEAADPSAAGEESSGQQ